jgi:hypothetical protein
MNIPENLLIGKGNLHIEEVTKAIYNTAMKEYAGCFFGICFKEKYYLKGSKKFFDILKLQIEAGKQEHD